MPSVCGYRSEEGRRAQQDGAVPAPGDTNCNRGCAREVLGPPLLIQQRDHALLLLTRNHTLLQLEVT